MISYYDKHKDIGQIIWVTLYYYNIDSKGMNIDVFQDLSFKGTNTPFQ